MLGAGGLFARPKSGIRGLGAGGCVLGAGSYLLGAVCSVLGAVCRQTLVFPQPEAYFEEGVEAARCHKRRTRQPRQIDRKPKIHIFARFSRWFGNALWAN